jgi:hypothetical protein
VKFCAGYAALAYLGVEAYTAGASDQDTITIATAFIMEQRLTLTPAQAAEAIWIARQMYLETGYSSERIGEIAMEACLDGGYAYE